MFRTLVILATVGGAAITAQNQPPDGSPSVHFEVASIKKNTASLSRGPGASRVGTQPGGRWVMVDGTTSVLLGTAYSDARDFVGAPDWVSSEKYDVEARAGRTVTREEMNAMLRSLLQDRFGLTMHYEMREQPSYALTIDRGGIKTEQLRPFKADCAAIADAIRRGDPAAAPQAPVRTNGALPCGYSWFRGQLAAGGIDMASVAVALEGSADRPVIDRTGLSGLFEFTLNVGDDQTIFTSLREQLGLRLESQKTALPVVVVDRIERPTPD
jgi:uncharacterized protein (TIGR03435 family)